ncbi:hypothetical protein V6R21_28885 [Limibacter armeniacum]|uniref:hypothetical protein n=1 Tax=Limibacter armeniacum TaxID=466084 RepID=UPI002FE57159
MDKRKLSLNISLIFFLVGIVFLVLGIYNYADKGLDKEAFLISALSFVLAAFRYAKYRKEQKKNQ